MSYEIPRNQYQVYLTRQVSEVFASDLAHFFTIGLFQYVDDGSESERANVGSYAQDLAFYDFLAKLFHFSRKEGRVCQIMYSNQG